MRRTVTIKDSSTQQTVRREIENATTFGDIKRAIPEINFAGKNAVDGISGAKLINDSDTLPSQSCYRGGLTDDLEIYLSRNRNIESGC